MAPRYCPVRSKKPPAEPQGKVNSAGAARCPKLAALTTPGNGAFVCGTVSGLDEDGETLTFVLARTWLSEDQLRDEQRFAVHVAAFDRFFLLVRGELVRSAHPHAARLRALSAFARARPD